MNDSLKLSCIWTLRVREHASGLLIAERRVKNVWTNYGLTSLAAGNGLPQYLVIEPTFATLNTSINGGASSLTISSRVDQAGDAQIVLSPGLPSQETVTFSSVTGSIGAYTYTLSGATTHSHTKGDPVCRQVSASDTLGNVVSEMQYDSVNFPGQRIASPGGYSGGNGNYVIQFFFPGPSAQGYFMLIGMSDSSVIGQGNLHNHFVLGYNHNSSSNDLEIDASISLVNG